MNRSSPCISFPPHLFQESLSNLPIWVVRVLCSMRSPSLFVLPKPLRRFLYLFILPRKKSGRVDKLKDLHLMHRKWIEQNACPPRNRQPGFQLRHLPDSVHFDQCAEGFFFFRPTYFLVGFARWEAVPFPWPENKSRHPSTLDVFRVDYSSPGRVGR